MRLAIVGLVAAAMLVTAGAAQARTMAGGEAGLTPATGEWYCYVVSATTSTWAHRVLVDRDLVPCPPGAPPQTSADEQALQQSGGFRMAAVPRHPETCYVNGVREERCSPYSRPGSSGGSGAGGVISDPLRWPWWFVPEP